MLWASRVTGKPQLRPINRASGKCLIDEQERKLIDDNLIDLVYNAAYLEGVRLTYVEARDFILGGKDPVKPYPTGLLKIKNLKTAYCRLKDEDIIAKPTDLETLCELNRIINGRGVSHDGGRIRSSFITITGTDYAPEIPDSYEVNYKIRDIVESKKTYVERGLDLYCYLRKTEVFYDGNKRSANLLCNQFLLRHGQGIFSIRPERNDQFLKLLLEYYKSDNAEKLKEFIYENCFLKDSSLPYVD